MKNSQPGGRGSRALWCQHRACLPALRISAHSDAPSPCAPSNVLELPLAPGGGRVPLCDSVSPRALRGSNLGEAVPLICAHLAHDLHKRNTSLVPSLLHSLWPAENRGQWLRLWAQEAGVHWGTRPAIARCPLGTSVSTKEAARGRLVAGGTCFHRQLAILTAAELGVLTSWGQAGGQSGTNKAGAAASDRWLPQPGWPGQPTSSSQPGRGGGLPESLMNINERRREKKINLPDSPMGAAVTI